MASDYDEEKDELKYNYKFENGAAPRSFGIQVAKMAGLPLKVLEIAKKRAEEMEETLNEKTKKLKI